MAAGDAPPKLYNAQKPLLPSLSRIRYTTRGIAFEVCRVAHEDGVAENLA